MGRRASGALVWSGTETLSVRAPFRSRTWIASRTHSSTRWSPPSTPNPSARIPILSPPTPRERASVYRSEEHTSELQSRRDLVCRLLLEKKNQRIADCQRLYYLRSFTTD